MKHGRGHSHRRRACLVQLPVLPPAALGSTGNSALSAGCLAVAVDIHGLGKHLDVTLLNPAVADELGDAALVESIVKERPSVVGFSLYVWNAERSLHVAREVRKHLPGTIVVIGGPEIQPDNAFLFAQDGFDVAVAGEGEEVFPELLDQWVRGGALEEIPGTAIRTAAGVSPLTPVRRATFPLSRYPSPYLAGRLPVAPDRSVYMETARGCAARCTFCFYSRGESAVRRVDAKVAARLAEQLEAAGARGIVLLDPTFNQRADFRQVLVELARINPIHRLSFFSEIRAEGLETGDVELMEKAGFTDVEIGLQSVNADTLKRIGRGGDPETVARVALEMKQRGIKPQVDLVVGLPGDGAADVLRGVEYLAEKGLAENVQILPLFVLPGTVLRQQAAGLGVVFDQSPPYRVLRTETMGEEEFGSVMARAEQILGRHLDEVARPHLASAPAEGIRDVTEVNIDELLESDIRKVVMPNARHAAIWLRGDNLFEKREWMARVIQRRLQSDPHSVLDVVLALRQEVPLDLVDFMAGVLAKAPPTYASRQLRWRPGNPACRLAAVIPQGAGLGENYLAHLADEIPVFRDMTLEEAIGRGAALGQHEPGARIVNVILSRDKLEIRRLAAVVDPEAVAFASRDAEAWWTRDILGYADVTTS